MVGALILRRIHVNRILKPFVVVVAAIYFLADAIFATIATPLARWIGEQRVFARLRSWIRSLRPYPSLALFAVPLIILEPVKPVAAYLAATGQVRLGRARPGRRRRGGPVPRHSGRRCRDSRVVGGGAGWRVYPGSARGRPAEWDDRG